MQQAVPAGEGAMAVVLGLEMDAVRALCVEAASKAKWCRRPISTAPDKWSLPARRALLHARCHWRKSAAQKGSWICP